MTRHDSRPWRFLALLLAAGCASAPPAPPAPVITYEQKMAWILRLEDQRVLRDPLPPVPPLPVPPLPVATSRRGAPPAPPPPPPPDLTRLVSDEDARVRRRAALAVGRVGVREGVDALGPLLQDPELEVRQMAIFALGLLGDRRGIDPLRAALRDPEPIVQGRAAEALGLIGEASAAPAIGEMVAAQVTKGVVQTIAADDLTHPLDPSVEAFRLGVYALARLNAFEPLAAAVLDAQGQPIVRWWPVAYALNRIEDRRAAPALRALARSQSVYGAAFAARGLGVLKDEAAVAVLVPLADARRVDPRVAASAIRALGQIGDAKAAPILLQLLKTPQLDPPLRLEVIAALGALRAADAVEPLLDLLADPWPALRAGALRAVQQIDDQTFITVLSGLDPDPQWSVRAALAGALGNTTTDLAIPRLTAMLHDDDLRVVPSVLSALARIHAPNATATLLEFLKHADPIVRLAAATNLGELKATDAVPALVEAYAAGAGDATYVARAAALGALARIGGADALTTLKKALQDRDWAVRVRAVTLLGDLDPAGDYQSTIRPAPTSRETTAYEAADLVSPAVSPHVYLETDKGTIQIELAVLDAPLTVENFMTLARKGFLDGLAIHRVVPNFVVQDGDPRGDGEGGPGYGIRDELNQLPYLRGTVGMALDWKDTGGSQYFITHSPQPHLDARYTVFGRVISGMEVVDRLQQWDVVRRVRVWDGKRAPE